MATYYVSGVCKNNTEVITHFYIRLVDIDSQVVKGVKTLRAEAITLSTHAKDLYEQFHDSI